MPDLLISIPFAAWVIFVIACALCLFSAVVERAVFAGMGVLLLVLGFWGFYGIKAYQPIFDSTLNEVIFVLAYGLIGVVWSVFKWRAHLLTEEVQFAVERARERYFYECPDADQYDYTKDEYCPLTIYPHRYKHKILCWIVNWPFSIIVYLFVSVFTRFFDLIYTKITDIYAAITRSHTR